MKSAIRIPANKDLERDIAELLTRPVGPPGHKPVGIGKAAILATISRTPG